MFGVRLRSLFTSRWMALLWAVLVILTAIGFVGSDDGGDTTAAQLSPEQQRAITNVF